MQERRSTTRRGLLGLALPVSLVLIVLGVVMADSHVPVAIEPDAPLAKGTQVATFAVG